MSKKTILSVLIVAAVATPLSITAGAANAQDYYGGWHDRGGWDRGGWNERRGWDDQRPEWHHRHHRDDGGVIAGGLAAGLVGGLLAGAIETGNTRYYVPAPQPQCWYQHQAVQDRYDYGYHYENVRVCN